MDIGYYLHMSGRMSVWAVYDMSDVNASFTQMCACVCVS